MSTVAVRRVEGTTVRTIRSIPPAQSAGPSRDIDAFIDLVATALVDHQQRLGTTEANRLTLREMSPKEAVESPDKGLNLVLVRLLSRKLRNTSNEGERRTWRPRHRREVQHPDEPDQIVTILTDERENIMEFQVVGPHSKRVDDFALFFEKFMLAYTWYFKDMGINDVRYVERGEDATMEIGGTELYIRPIRFYVQTQTVYQENRRKLDEVLVHYDVGQALETTVVNEEFGVSDDKINHAVAHGSNS